MHLASYASKGKGNGNSWPWHAYAIQLGPIDPGLMQLCLQAPGLFDPIGKLCVESIAKIDTLLCTVFCAGVVLSRTNELAGLFCAANLGNAIGLWSQLTLGWLRQLW